MGGDFTKDRPEGRNINYGVREHAMAAINNGIALHERLRVFSGGFFVFSDYMKPAIRLSAMMKLPVIYIFHMIRLWLVKMDQRINRLSN